MTVQILQFLDALNMNLLPAILIFLRVGAAFALVPVLGEQSIPQRIRIVLAVAITVILYPALVENLPNQVQNLWVFMGYGWVEVIAGLAIGISLRLFVHTLQIAGSIAAQATSLSQIFGGAAVDPQPAIGHFLVVGGLALAVTMGLHVQIARFLIYSYEMMPAGHAIAAVDLSDWGVDRIARAFSLGFAVAAPFLLASMVYNITLGAVNRAMPQLMVSFVGAPAITAGGIILLFLTAPLILSVWFDALSQFLNDPRGDPLGR